MTLEISKLSNGLTVVSDPMVGLESAAVGIWVNTGSRNETPAQMGVSHMLEHMAFKGTTTRSARAIAEEIEAVGGVLNAYTSREQTAFHARILKQEGYIANYEVDTTGQFPQIKVINKLQNRTSAITGLKRISKPGLRKYVGVGEIPRVLGGMGISILSTPRGIVSGREAKKQNVGGELLAYVW